MPIPITRLFQPGSGNMKADQLFFQIPVSSWSSDKKMKEVGLYFHATWTTDLEGLSQFMFSNVMGWEKEEISTYIAHLKSELKDPSNHGYMTFRSVYSQKPLDG